MTAEVERQHPVAGRHEPGRQVGPVLGGLTERVQQHRGRRAGLAEVVVRQLDAVGLQALTGHGQASAFASAPRRQRMPASRNPSMSPSKTELGLPTS